MKMAEDNTQEKGSDRSDHCSVFGENKKKHTINRAIGLTETH